MGLLDHKNEFPCPHGGCGGKLVITKSNLSGGIKGIDHQGGTDHHD